MADNRPIDAGWFALCDVDQLSERAIYHTELHGHELVVWRAGDGAINVWENRCPHRGVRLSIGHHRGDALQCQYHGWQFGSGDGACRFVPAHPDAAPPRVAVTTWPVQVRYGLVWTCLAQTHAQTQAQTETRLDQALPPFASIDELEHDTDPPTPIRLRTVAIDAPSEAVQRALADYRFDHATFDPWKATECVAFDAGAHAVVVEQLDDAQQRVVFLVQPARAARTYLHGVALGIAARNPAQKLIVQRHHQQRLNVLRDTLEQQARPPRSDSVTARNTLAIPAASLTAQPIFLQPTISRAVSPANGSTPGVANAAPAAHVEDHAFTVHLSRSETTLSVPAGASLLQVLREHRVAVPSSCEQGVCGTCRARVIDGTPLHRDAFLTPQERAAGDCMLVCVSRAAGAALTLDL